MVLKMKKLLAIVVLGLLWCNFVYADHQCGGFEIFQKPPCEENNTYNKHTCKCEGYFDQFEGGVPLSEKEKIELDFSEAEYIAPKKMSGSILLCENKREKIYDFGIEFKRLNRMTITGIDEEKERLLKINGTYDELSNKIIINYRVKGEKEKAEIFRSSGSISGFSNTLCELYSGKLSIDDRLKQTLKEHIGIKSSGNKF